MNEAFGGETHIKFTVDEGGTPKLGTNWRFNLRFFVGDELSSGVPSIPLHLNCLGMRYASPVSYAKHPCWRNGHIAAQLLQKKIYLYHHIMYKHQKHPDEPNTLMNLVHSKMKSYKI